MAPPQPSRPKAGTIDLERYAAATDLAARAAAELALIVGSVGNLAAQLANATAERDRLGEERDRLAADLAEARLLLEAFRQVAGDPPGPPPAPIPSDPSPDPEATP